MSRILSTDLINQSMQGSGIGFPIHFHECARDFSMEIVRLDGHARSSTRFFIGIVPEEVVIAAICWST